MTDSVHTRIAAPDDLAELARLNRLFNGGETTAEQIAARLADPRCVETPIIADVDNRIVGFAALRVVPCIFYSTPHAELTELYVEDGYRQRGVGRALIAHTARLALERGAETLLVLTWFENAAAQSLYRAMGFEDDELAMCKVLGA